MPVVGRVSYEPLCLVHRIERMTTNYLPTLNRLCGISTTLQGLKDGGEYSKYIMVSMTLFSGCRVPCVGLGPFVYLPD